MSQDSSNPKADAAIPADSQLRTGWWRPLIGYSIWLVVSFVGAYALLYVTAFLLNITIGPLTNYMSENLAVVLLGFVTYGYMLAILVLGPRFALKRRIDKVVMGLTKWPTLVDLGVAVLGLIVYFVLGAIIISLTSSFIDVNQAQNLGVSNLLPGMERWIALVLYVVVGPIIEELIFRGYLYGQLIRAKVPLWLRVLVVSALFGAAHLQWNVGINVAVLSVVMCLAREWRGSIWAGIFMHVAKNGLAFYLLFFSGII